MWSRKSCVSVQNVHHTVFKPRQLASYKGTYAVTSLTAFFPNTDDDEDIVCDFLEDFQSQSKKYYNLRQLHIHAPHAVFNGNMVKTMSQNMSSATNLHLDMFAFHSPQHDMWDTSIFNKINATFHDGVAFPMSASLLFQGLGSNNHVQNVSIINESPHKPKVILPKSLMGKVVNPNDSIILCFK